MKYSVLITGASTGIGRGLSIALAKKGWVVFAGVRSESVMDELRKDHDNIRPLLLDVTDDEQVRQAVKEINNSNLPLQALINNAGVGAGGPVEGSDLQQWEKVFHVNIFGAVRMTKAFLPLLRESKGRVINISSVAALLALPYLPIYASSKFALEGFTDSLRREVTKLGVYVSLIEPGPIKTPIWEKGLGESSIMQMQATEEVQQVYQRDLSNFEELVQQKKATALGVEKVVVVVERALTSKIPKARYVVAKNQWQYLLLKFIPTSIVDKLLSRI